MLGEMEQQSLSVSPEPQSTVDDLRVATLEAYRLPRQETAPELPVADLYALGAKVDALRARAIDEAA